jgi:predicted phosphodiesterase
LVKSGAKNPLNMTLTNGRYLVVSDSHGKHTSRGMFRLLNNLNNNLKFDAVIHIGHILDDDNDISYLWKDFSNFIVVAR